MRQRVVRESEVRANSNCKSDRTLQDEEPLPSRQVADTIEPMEDARCDEASERGCKDVAGV